MKSVRMFQMNLAKEKIFIVYRNIQNMLTEFIVQSTVKNNKTTF